jgi:hypothetical protein
LTIGKRPNIRKRSLTPRPPVAPGELRRELIAIVFDFVEPGVAAGGLVDQGRQLRFDETRRRHQCRNRRQISQVTLSWNPSSRADLAGTSSFWQRVQRRKVSGSDGCIRSPSQR